MANFGSELLYAVFFILEKQVDLGRTLLTRMIGTIGWGQATAMVGPGGGDKSANSKSRLAS